ncbi:hypothetical protein D3C75_1319170 [compost metagenome]
MPAVLPMALNTPPVMPTISFGAVSATTAKPRLPKPLPKNARLMTAITSTCEST